LGGGAALSLEEIRANVIRMEAEIKELTLELQSGKYILSVRKAIRGRIDNLQNNVRMARKRIIQLERKLSKL
jgi:hypothetical protein